MNSFHSLTNKSWQCGFHFHSFSPIPSSIASTSAWSATAFWANTSASIKMLIMRRVILHTFRWHTELLHLSMVFEQVLTFKVIFGLIMFVIFNNCSWLHPWDYFSSNAFCKGQNNVKLSFISIPEVFQSLSVILCVIFFIRFGLKLTFKSAMRSSLSSMIAIPIHLLHSKDFSVCRGNLEDGATSLFTPSVYLLFTGDF